MCIRESRHLANIMELQAEKASKWLNGELKGSGGRISKYTSIDADFDMLKYTFHLNLAKLQQGHFMG